MDWALYWSWVEWWWSLGPALQILIPFVIITVLIGIPIMIGGGGD